jgi:hypothetical protein
MGQVVSFDGFTPPARFDDLAWQEVRIEEAPVPSGPWTLIDTLTLDPVDDDPADPQARNLTTEQASDEPDLWYRLVFVDADGDTSLATSPLQNSEPSVDGRALCTAEDLRAYLPEFFADVDDGPLNESINAESDDFQAHTRREIRTENDAPTTRVFDIDWLIVEERELLIDDAAEISSVTIKDPTGTIVVSEPPFVDMPRNRQSFEPITSLWFPGKLAAAAPLAPGQTVEITGVWGWPAVPSRVRRAVVIFVARAYVRNLTAYSDSAEEILPDIKSTLARDVKWALDVRSSLRIPKVG